MMAGGVILGEVVYHIVFSGHPIYQKLSLSDSVYDPVNLHVYGSSTSLVYVVIDISVSCGAVRHFWGRRLGMANFC